MTPKMNRMAKWTAGAVLVVILAAYGEFVREAMRFSPAMLLVWVDEQYAPIGWTCRQILERHSLTPERVAELNKDAGARYPIYMRDPKVAEEMLQLFIDRGVDVNAGNEKVRNWTALFDPILDGKADRVAMLLRHGARVDVLGTDGMTPLDYAREMVEKHPSESGRVDVVRLLEQAEKPSAKR